MTEIGTIYGNALYDLAVSENLTEEILAQLKALAESFSAEPSFLKLLGTRSIPKEERCRIIDDSFGDKLHAYVRNFLKLLTEKGYIRYFTDCLGAFQARYNRDHNILPVTAVTAVALNEGQIARLVSKLETQTGKTVEITNRIDPEVLGGMRLDFDGKSVEDTLSHRLENLRHLLNNTIL